MTKTVDAFSRTKLIEEHLGSHVILTQYAYTRFGDLKSITDADGIITTYAYDSLGRRVTTDHPDRGLTTVLWDDADSPIEVIDASGRRDTTSYDGLGRVERTESWFVGGASPEHVTTRVWDVPVTMLAVRPGQLAEIADEEGSSRFGYDQRGRTIETRRALTVTGSTYTTRSVYDELDRPLHITYPSTPCTAPVTVAYTHDAASHVTEVRVFGASAVDVGKPVYSAESFSAFDLVERFRYGNGVVTDMDWYDHRVLPKRMTATGADGVIQDLGYTYDALGSVTSISDGVGTGAASATLSNIGYDALNRLSGYTRSGQTVAFDYTDAGNVRVNTELDTQPYTYSSDHPHAVSTAGSNTYEYDAAGRMTLRNGVSLHHDAAGRLVHAEGNGVDVRFGYDATGQRIWRRDSGSLTVWSGSHFELRDGRVLCHVLLGTKRLCTFEAASVTGAAAGGACGDLPSVAGGLAGSGGAAPASAPAGGSVGGSATRDVELGPSAPIFFYYHADHLNSSNVVTGSDGRVVQRLEYEAYGEVRHEDGGDGLGVGNLFTDHVLDRATGLYYMGARYYDPAVARFISPDPVDGVLDDPQSLNPYTYAANNPLKYVDPTGAFPEDTNTASDEPFIPGETLEGGQFLMDNPDGESGSESVEIGEIVAGDVAGFDEGLGSLGVQVKVGARNLLAAGQVLRGVDPISLFTSLMDILSIALDLTGVGGAVSWIPDLISAAVNYSAGRNKEAVASLAGAVPFFGSTVNAGRLGVKAVGLGADALRVPQLGRKLDYFLGLATGNSHNIERTSDLLRQLQRAGLHDSPATRDYLTKHLTDVLNDGSNIAAREGARVTRESILSGPQGILKFESVWEGDKLITGFFLGGP